MRAQAPTRQPTPAQSAARILGRLRLPDAQRWLQYLVIALIGLLITEGVIRKLMPSGLSQAFILVKDVMVLAMWVFLTRLPPPEGFFRHLQTAWLILSAAMIPLLIHSALKDPILLIWGAKQYLLFPTLVLAVGAAFRRVSPLEASRPARWITLALYPIVAMSALQLFLPVSHWLNRSVSGDDLSAFSAGGHLRISGPFPFIAQYCWFLHFAIFAAVFSFGVRKATGKVAGWLLHPAPVLLLLVVANVITGSRLSALGTIIILAISLGLVVMRGRAQSLRDVVLLLALGAGALFMARWLVPQAFAALDARTEGLVVEGEFGEEYTGRMRHNLTGWMEVAAYHQPGFLGFGLGTMSNGVDKLSGYTAQIRSRVWGEADLPNTVLEGGYYLVFVWMAFRIYVIILCILAFFRLQQARLVFAGAVALGAVIFNGLFATLGTQPPLAIWWYLSISSIFLLERLEPFWVAQARLARQARQSGTAVPTTPLPSTPA